MLVNDIWGAEHLFEWDKPVWEHDLDDGLRLLRLAIDTHLITSHHALPLLCAAPGGLVVEVTDGTAAYNADHYRVSIFYDLAKTSVIRIAWAQAQELGAARRHRRRADPRLDALGGDARAPRRERGQLARGHRAHAALLHLGVAALRRPRRRRARRRPGRSRWNGQSLSSGGLAQVYGFTDLDGTRPDCWRYMVEVVERGRPAGDAGYR